MTNPTGRTSPVISFFSPESVVVPNPTESFPSSSSIPSTTSEPSVSYSDAGSPFGQSGNPNVLRRISKKVPAPKPPTVPAHPLDAKQGNSAPPMSASSPRSVSPKFVRPRETPPPPPQATVERSPPPVAQKPSTSSSSENVADTEVKLYPAVPDADFFAVPEKPTEKQHRRQASDCTPPPRPMPPPPPPPSN